MYNTALLTIVTMLYSTYQDQFILQLEVFILCLHSPISPTLTTTHLHLWQPPIYSLYLWVLFFSFLDVKYRWDHTVFVFLCLSHFAGSLCYMLPNSVLIHTCWRRKSWFQSFRNHIATVLRSFSHCPWKGVHGGWVTLSNRKSTLLALPLLICHLDSLTISCTSTWSILGWPTCL